MRPSFEKVLPSASSSFRCYQRDDPLFEFNWHFHPEFELTYIIESRGRRFVGDDIDDYAAGDLVLLGANLPHTWYSGKPQRRKRHRAIVVQFLRDAFGGATLFDIPEMRSVARLLDERSSRGLRFTGSTQRDAARRMTDLLDARGARKLILLVEILDLLSRSLRCVELASAGYRPPAYQRHVGRHRFDEVCTYINENYAERIVPSQAAKIAGLSASAFCRFFRSTTGKTLTQYVNDLRVAHACRLLTESDLPIVDICFRSGFANVSNFNRRFLELTNLSPRAYRRAMTAEAIPSPGTPGEG